MTQEELLHEFNTLPPDAQQQVVDFIAFLRERYKPTTRKNTAKRPKDIAKEAFIGIWQDRADMADSGAWVREARSDEWGAQLPVLLV